jgi:quinol monooxygenase YgiN
MYARLVRFSLGPGKRSIAQAVADDLQPAISAQPGCKSVTVFGDDADGEYGLFVLWASQAEADAASQIMRPKLEQHIAGNAKGPPDARLFEVISK